MWINGTLLRRTVPYVPHEFDFTGHAKKGSNNVALDMVDACPGPGGLGKDALDFGVTVGGRPMAASSGAFGRKFAPRHSLTMSALGIRWTQITALRHVRRLS